MRAQCVVELGGEDGVGAEESFDAHGRGHVDGGEQVLQVGQGHDEHAEHAVGAVDEREAFLLGQCHRGDSGGSEDLVGRSRDSVGSFGHAFAHDDEGTRRQGREVAGAAE